MSAIERRIADFVLDNAQLLRDYSSQQLANALGISQSSVVKFCQKLGFKGYPDLKYSIGDAIARANNGDSDDSVPASDDDAPIASDLWRRKTEAEEETRSINPATTLGEVATALAGSAPSASDLWRRETEDEEATRSINPATTLGEVATALAGSARVFIIGLGEDDIHARSFALRLSLLGILPVHNFDTAHMAASVCS